MTTKEKVVRLLRENLAYLASEYGVQRIGLFGSCAKNALSPDSDIDVLVEFARPVGFRFVDFAEFLEKLLGRKVDVLTPAGLRGIRIGRVADAIKESLIYV